MWNLITYRFHGVEHYELETDEDAELAYSMLIGDLRRFFGVSFYDAGTKRLSYEEMSYLIIDLMADTESRFGAFKNGYDYRVKSTDKILADTYDLLQAANRSKGAKLTPYPRPKNRDEEDKKKDIDVERVSLTREQMLEQKNKLFKKKA